MSPANSWISFAVHFCEGEITMQSLAWCDLTILASPGQKAKWSTESRSFVLALVVAVVLPLTGCDKLPPVPGLD
jgi:hypothetical protein